MYGGTNINVFFNIGLVAIDNFSLLRLRDYVPLPRNCDLRVVFGDAK
jgi:hypothetical protein